jgi:hypothetical protein
MNVKKYIITKAVTSIIAFVILVPILIGCKQNATTENTPSKEMPTKYTPSEIKPSWQPSSSHIAIETPKTFADGSTGVCRIKIDGQIDKYTAGNLAYIYNSTNDPQCKKFISINSPGGDVIGAINTGEFIRQKEMFISVGDDNFCASSCVLLFLGGVDRFVSGKIGLHRPYSESYSESDSQARAKYESINLLIRSYLKRMNIPDRLLDEMNATSPSEIKWLKGWDGTGTPDDGPKLSELYISGKDPVWYDRTNSEEAKKLGISMEEFYKRVNKAGVFCSSVKVDPNKRMNMNEFIDAMKQCEDEVMAGKR